MILDWQAEVLAQDEVFWAEGLLLCSSDRKQSFHSDKREEMCFPVVQGFTEATWILLLSLSQTWQKLWKLCIKSTWNAQMTFGLVILLLSLKNVLYHCISKSPYVLTVKFFKVLSLGVIRSYLSSCKLLVNILMPPTLLRTVFRRKI